MRDDSDPTPALALDGVSFAYAGAPVVREVTLRLRPGAMVALLGPNGAGKSTLLKLASGILRPNKGSISLAGTDLRRLARDAVARRVAVVPQDFAVQFAYTVRQVVELGRMPHMGAWSVARAADRAAVDAALAATNTHGLAERIFNELSGGERQRALLALALAQDAPIVLLDEPTAHLDIRHQIETLDLLRRLNRERGITVLAALHDLNLASRYFPRLVLIRTHILADGPPAHVLRDDLLSRAYDIPVRVGILRGEEHLSIVPPAFEGFAGQVIHVADDTPASRVHVLAGGGSGELLMRALADTGIPFTAGPLNAGDTDHALAERLAMQTLAEPPYAPVSAQGLAAARDLIRAAGAVVVCPMPIGPGNLALLDAALDARRAGLSVILLEPTRLTLSAESGASENEVSELAAIAARDFSGGAAERYAALAEAGAIWAGSPAEVVALLGGEIR